MSVRSGLSNFVYRLPTTTLASTVQQRYPIVVPRGTYIINANISMVSNTNVFTGTLFSLQTTNVDAPTASVADVILRNTVGSGATTLALPSGSSLTQAYSLSCVYTFATDATIYLNISGVAAASNWSVTASVAPSLLNTLQFIQIAS
jgi:hypothetical protein